ncbi:MAG: sigma-70 family RNA polymerase sigma factor [Blastocatellales bacterium]
MPKSNSEPKSDHDAPPEELFVQALPLLGSTVRVAFLRYHQSPTPGDMERFSQRLIILLLEDDFRRLRSFDERSSLRTWLQTLTNRYVGSILQQERRNLGLEELPSEFFTSEPSQEDEIREKEKMILLGKALRRLTKQERRLFVLLRQDGATAEDIARDLGIKKESVYRTKNELIKKLQRWICKFEER